MQLARRNKAIVLLLITTLLVAVTLATVAPNIALAHKDKKPKKVIKVAGKIIKVETKTVRQGSRTKIIKIVRTTEKVGDKTVITITRTIIKDDKPKPPKDALEGKILISGSSTVKPIADDLARSFVDKHKRVRIQIKANGSNVGIQEVSAGKVDIGMISRDIRPEETAAGLAATKLGQDVVAIYVNSNNPVNSFTKDQVTKVYNGTITNWQTFGGKNAPILPMGFNSTAGTYDYFMKTFMGGQTLSSAVRAFGTNLGVRRSVAATDTAVGYASLAFDNKRVRPVFIDGVAPTYGNARAGKYPYVRNLNFVTKSPASKATNEFIKFTLSNEGKRIMQKHNLIIE
ncbi:MAG: phosphate ABC transporter substrate-binding protein [Actinobacteria bacterium]|nr:phosphate ABC transporter substrate-binding protein [Actinomycetota bacterium]